MELLIGNALIESVTVFTDFVPTSQETPDVCTEVTDIYSELCAKHLNTLLKASS
jgi:hypothetical protein